jgi:MFS family permease
MILYLSYFYKHAELSIRLGFWWTAMSIADILAAFLGFGLLHLRGHLGHAGWQWLFLVEGLFTFVIGIIAFGLMPPSPTQTKHWFRGSKGWFTERSV